MTTLAPPRFVPRWRRACDAPVSALVLSPDGRNLAAATEDGHIVMLDATSGVVAWCVSGHADGTTSLDWTSDSALLVSGGRDGNVSVRARDDITAVRTVGCGSTWVERVAVAPHGRSFAAACGRQVSWYSTDGNLIMTSPRLQSTILDVAWRPARGASVLACVAYGAVTLFKERDGGRSSRELKWAGSSLVLAWSPNGRFIATGDQDSTVHFWIVKHAEDLMMSGYARKVRELAWSPDTRYLATGGGAAITVWDCAPPGPAGSEPIVLEAHDAPVRSLAFRGDGSLLASCAADGSVAVWDVGRREAVATLDGDGEAAVAVRWSGDGRTLYVADVTGMITAWEEA